MKKFTDTTIPEHTERTLDGMICDRCKVETSIDDRMELQEAYTIDFIGGYDSVFGDGNHIECDLCQRCLHELIKNYCRTVERMF